VLVGCSLLSGLLMQPFCSCWQGSGSPIDLAIARRAAFAFDLLRRIKPGEPYFHNLSERWSAALRAAHKSIPRPPYGLEPS
jgi:putative proteasome-type protease